MREHMQNTRQSSPPSSVHALPLDALRCAPGITFWSAWQDGAFAGLRRSEGTRRGAWRDQVDAHGLAAFAQRGGEAELLAHILEEARRRAYRRISLETGSSEAFTPARTLDPRRPRDSDDAGRFGD